MNGRPQRPSLMFHLGWQFVARAIKKPLFGRPYLRFGPFLMVSLWLYTTGAVLGRARRDRLEILAKMLCDPGREHEFCQFLRDLAAERLEKYGKEPESFFDFFMTTEYREAGFAWPPSDLQTMKRADNLKITVEQAEPKMKMYTLEGVGLGAGFPDLTETMWRQTYERFDRDSWARARHYGLDIPEEPVPVSFEEREQQVLIEVAYYATEYFPELVEPLGLRVK